MQQEWLHQKRFSILSEMLFNFKTRIFEGKYLSDFKTLYFQVIF